MSKVGNPEFEKKAKQVLVEAKVLVSSDYVAKKLHIGFATARALLFGLTIKDEVELIRTSGTPLFRLSNNKGKGDDNGVPRNG